MYLFKFFCYLFFRYVQSPRLNLQAGDGEQLYGSADYSSCDFRVIFSIFNTKGMCLFQVVLGCATDFFRFPNCDNPPTHTLFIWKSDSDGAGGSRQGRVALGPRNRRQAPEVVTVVRRLRPLLIGVSRPALMTQAYLKRSRNLLKRLLAALREAL